MTLAEMNNQYLPHFDPVILPQVLANSFTLHMLSNFVMLNKPIHL